jgi:galactofuranose transport system permease protein
MKRLLQSRHLPTAATLLVLVALYVSASFLYPGFFSVRVLRNLLGDNAFLGITAIGMTFVILSGGIDLSVGAVVAFTTIFLARLIERAGMHPGPAIALALIVGASFGAGMGLLIHRYGLPPFLVTLGGMFFARGMSFLISQESLGITHSFYRRVLDFGLPIGGGVSLPATAVILLGVFALAVLTAHWSPFGRNVYAVGGSESSALLMGLPVGTTKVLVYTLNGFCSALAGVVATFYMGSGNPATGFGLELDAIASVVIGGTLLTGGVGTIAGTLVGVLIFGTIQTALVFDGRLNSWWLRIAIGVLLMLFILLQRFLARAGAFLPGSSSPAGRST